MSNDKQRIMAALERATSTNYESDCCNDLTFYRVADDVFACAKCKLACSATKCTNARYMEMIDRYADERLKKVS